MRPLKTSAALVLALLSIAFAAVAATSVHQDESAVAERSKALERTHQQPSAARVGSLIASYAHSIACAKAGLLNAFCDHPHTAATELRRNDIVGHAMQTTTSWTTIESTSTIGSTTTTVYVMPTTASSTTGGVGWIKFALITDSTSTTVSNPTEGVSIVDTTVVKTITYHTSAISTSTTEEVQPTSTATKSCTNNTAIDTQAYINISTFSVTGLSYAPESTSPTFIPFFTACNSSVVTADATSTVSTSTATRTISTDKTTSVVSTITKAVSTDDTRGFTGAVTSTLGSASSKSINFDGLQPVANVAAALAICCALAFMLL